MRELLIGLIVLITCVCCDSCVSVECIYVNGFFVDNVFINNEYV